MYSGLSKYEDKSDEPLSNVNFVGRPSPNNNVRSSKLNKIEPDYKRREILARPSVRHLLASGFNAVSTRNEKVLRNVEKLLCSSLSDSVDPSMTNDEWCAFLAKFIKDHDPDSLNDHPKCLNKHLNRPLSFEMFEQCQHRINKMHNYGGLPNPISPRVLKYTPTKRILELSKPRPCTCSNRSIAPKKTKSGSMLQFNRKQKDYIKEIVHEDRSIVFERCELLPDIIIPTTIKRPSETSRKKKRNQPSFAPCKNPLPRKLSMHLQSNRSSQIQAKNVQLMIQRPQTTRSSSRVNQCRQTLKKDAAPIEFKLRCAPCENSRPEIIPENNQHQRKISRQTVQFLSKMSPEKMTGTAAQILQNLPSSTEAIELHSSLTPPIPVHQFSNDPSTTVDIESDGSLTPPLPVQKCSNDDASDCSSCDYSDSLSSFECDSNPLPESFGNDLELTIITKVTIKEKVSGPIVQTKTFENSQTT